MDGIAGAALDADRHRSPAPMSLCLTGQHRQAGTSRREPGPPEVAVANRSLDLAEERLERLWVADGEADERDHGELFDGRQGKRQRPADEAPDATRFGRRDRVQVQYGDAA
jgi:hypothetical protein